MAIFYILQDPESLFFLSDIKNGFWDGYYDPASEQYIGCAIYKTLKSALVAKVKASNYLRIDFPEDPEASWDVRVCKIRTEIVKKTIHKSI